MGLEVLEGRDEAELTFLAARRWFGWSAGRLLVLDIAGGSLEIATGMDEEAEVAVSVPLGAGRLTRERLAGDPPPPPAIKELRPDPDRAGRTRGDSAWPAGPRGRDVEDVPIARSDRRRSPAEEGPYVRRTLSYHELREVREQIASIPDGDAGQAAWGVLDPGASARRRRHPRGGGNGPFRAR